MSQSFRYNTYELNGLLIQVLILQACQVKPSNKQPMEDGEEDEELPDYESYELDGDIADHIKEKLSEVTEEETLEDVLERHKQPSNVEVPEHFNVNSQQEEDEHKHDKIQRLALTSLYAIGKVGTKIAEEDLGDLEEPLRNIEDAITLFSMVSHHLHEKKNGDIYTLCCS